jgi:hypothetical protein
MRQKEINSIIDKQYGDQIYKMWYKMRRRCNLQSDPAYHNYGGRGICVCEEWNDHGMFDNFYNFIMSIGYSPGLSIDRIDNNGNYEPSNVRLVTPRENCRNKRNNTIIEINGESKTLAEWAEISGVGRATIGWRYKHGVSGQDLLKKESMGANIITIDGIRKPLCEWSREYNIRPDTLMWRIKHNYTRENLLSAPDRRRSRRKRGDANAEP